jgi:hypothetical protein
MSATRLFVPIFTLALSTGCEAVPDIDFVQDDAQGNDGGTDANGDAPRDATDAADAREGGCPIPGFPMCCGTIPCSGPDCTIPSTCTKCQANCQAGDVCCTKNGASASCHLLAQVQAQGCP